jgi:broad specificity phosphatase PhoE
MADRQTSSPKEMHLYLFRHAETTYNADGTLIGGRSNHIPLSERGIKQAYALGGRLAEEGTSYDFVYSSPALRSRATAEIACRVIGFDGKIVIREDIQELSQGDLEGKKRAEVYTQPVLARMALDPLNYHAPNGESPLDVQKRMHAFVNGELVAKLDGNDRINVAVFGHGFSFKCFLRGVLNFDPALTYKVPIENCSITELKYFKDSEYPRWHIVRVNDFEHIVKIGYKL